MGKPAPFGVDASGTPTPPDLANCVVTGTFGAVGPGDPFAFFGWTNLAIYASANSALTTTNGSLAASVASGTGIAAGDAINSINVPAGTTWATFSGTSGTLALPAITIYGFLNSSGQISGLGSIAGLLGATVTGPNIPSGGLTVVATQVPGTVQLSGPATGTLPVLTTNSPYRFALTASAVTTGVDTAAIFTGASVTFSGTVQLERSFDGGSTWLLCNIGSAGTPAQWTGTVVTPISTAFAESERGVLYRLNCTSYSSGTINYRLSQTAAMAMSIGLAAPV